MAQEIKRPDGIEIVITSVCVRGYVHVGWGGVEVVYCCVCLQRPEEDFLYSVLCL